MSMGYCQRLVLAQLFRMQNGSYGSVAQLTVTELSAYLAKVWLLASHKHSKSSEQPLLYEISLQITIWLLSSLHTQNVYIYIYIFYLFMRELYACLFLYNYLKCLSFLESFCFYQPLRRMLVDSCESQAQPRNP